jgi:apolipoprotein D and lipocalin family protein
MSNKVMTKNLLILLTMLSIFSCKTAKDLPTVNKVDLTKYSGLWYEIARLPNSFEKGLECVTATYTVKPNGKIAVLNQGRPSTDKTKLKSAKGTGWLPNANYPGRLLVSFFWPFSGNYYIIALDENYNYALVGDPSRKYLWILARSKELDAKSYSKLLETANMNGFDIEKIIKIKQDCN